MGLFSRWKPKNRSEPGVNSVVCLPEQDFDEWCLEGYLPLSKHPDVKVCIKKIAELISSTTIYLMQSQKRGNVRIKNGLSRKIDIDPNPYLTRKVLYQTVAEELLLYGNSILLPVYDSDGYLAQLKPIPHNQVSLHALNDGGYYAVINGWKFQSSEIINFVNNPKTGAPWQGESYKVYLKDVLNNIKLSQKIKSNYYTKDHRPGLIFSFAADNDLFMSKEQREEIYRKWVETKPGQPYVLPQNLVDVKTFSPMSLKDIAVNESVEIDKRFIAALVGATPYMAGIGSYSREEHNNCILTAVKPITTGMGQELTKKIIYANDLFFYFNTDSLIDYDPETKMKIMYEGRAKAVYSGNECRIKNGDEPVDDPAMDEYVLLENYIRVQDSGNQKKLVGNEE